MSIGVGAARLGISGCGGCTLGPGHVVVPPEQYRGLVAWHPSAASRSVDASAEYSSGEKLQRNVTYLFQNESKIP